VTGDEVELMAGEERDQPSEAAAYHPAPTSGARPIRVPRPEEILRRGYQPAQADESLDTEDRGGRAENRRWRTGRPPASDRQPSSNERPVNERPANGPSAEKESNP
jgi:hypothetical protein